MEKETFWYVKVIEMRTFSKIIWVDAKLITNVLTGRKQIEKWCNDESRELWRCYIDVFEDRQRGLKPKYLSLYKLEKVLKQILLRLWSGVQSYQQHSSGPVKLILDSWPPELLETKFVQLLSHQVCYEFLEPL